MKFANRDDEIRQARERALQALRLAACIRQDIPCVRDDVVKSVLIDLADYIDVAISDSCVNDRDILKTEEELRDEREELLSDIDHESHVRQLVIGQ